MQVEFCLKRKESVVIIVVSFTREIFLVTKIILQRQPVMPKSDEMNAKLGNDSKWEPAKEFKENPTHKFTWAIISKAPEDCRKRRVLVAYFTQTICFTLNEQLTNDILTPFRNGITYM